MNKDLEKSWAALAQKDLEGCPIAPGLSITLNLENWHPELHKLSMKSVSIELDRDEMIVLGKSMAEVFEYFDEFEWPTNYPRSEYLNGITRRIDDLVGYWKDGFFVRLGSRSPKDSAYGQKYGFKCRIGKEAIDLLLDVSERMAEDILFDLQKGRNTHIWLREWVKIPRLREFRVFYNRGVKAISQYFYKEKFDKPELAPLMLERITRFVEEKVATYLPVNECVIDVFFRGDNPLTDLVLIELNPWGWMTDPCLCNWEELENSDVGVEFRIKEK